jgi:hypothetical protein
MWRRVVQWIRDISTLKTKAVAPPKRRNIYQTTQCYVPEDSYLNHPVFRILIWTDSHSQRIPALNPTRALGIQNMKRSFVIHLFQPYIFNLSSKHGVLADILIM